MRPSGELAEAAGIGILARSDAKRGFEAALQVKRTLPKSLSQTLKRDGFIKVLFDVAADLFRQVRLWIAADRAPDRTAGNRRRWSRRQRRTLRRGRDRARRLRPSNGRH